MCGCMLPIGLGAFCPGRIGQNCGQNRAESGRIGAESGRIGQNRAECRAEFVLFGQKTGQNFRAESEFFRAESAKPYFGHMQCIELALDTDSAYSLLWTQAMHRACFGHMQC